MACQPKLAPRSVQASEGWRRERDSNPRNRFPVQWFSRPPPSTTRPSLRVEHPSPSSVSRGRLNQSGKLGRDDSLTEGAREHVARTGERRGEGHLRPLELHHPKGESSAKSRRRGRNLAAGSIADIEGPSHALVLVSSSMGVDSCGRKESAASESVHVRERFEATLSLCVSLDSAGICETAVSLLAMCFAAAPQTGIRCFRLASRLRAKWLALSIICVPLEIYVPTLLTRENLVPRSQNVISRAPTCDGAFRSIRLHCETEYHA